MDNLGKRSFVRDYAQSVFSAWYLVVIAVAPAVISAVTFVFAVGGSPWLWVSIGLAGLVCAQFIAARRVWLHRYGDVRGRIDDCLREGQRLQGRLLNGNAKTSPHPILKWVLLAEAVLRDGAPAHAGEVLKPLPAANRQLIGRVVDAVTNESVDLTKQEASTLLSIFVDRLRAVRKELESR